VVIVYELKSAVKDFISHCTYEKNLSTKTIKSYLTDLRQLSSFLMGNYGVIDIQNVTKLELRDYIKSISSLKPKSRKRKIATIKALLNYMEYEDKILVNPFRKMKIKIKENIVLPSVLNLSEIKRIFGVAYGELNTKKNYGIKSNVFLRNVAVIELLFATGARVSEIANLKKSDIDLNTGLIKFKGKGNKERIIQVSSGDTIKILVKYEKLYREKIQESSNYFFINRLNSKLSDQSIRGLVKNLSKKAYIGKKVTPHTFRHSFATLLLENDVDIKYIQNLMGHSSITTTQIYTHVNVAKIMEILKIKHPRKDLGTFAIMDN
jgi:integrase/recombinase XerD